MKQISLSIIAGSISFLSCNQKNTTNAEGNLQTGMSTDTVGTIVSLKCVPDAFHLSSIPDTLHTVTTNNTNDTITTGTYYEIEHFESQQWVKVSPDQAFQDIGFSIYPKESKKLTVSLLKDQIRYKAGVYRLVKYYLKPDYKKTRSQLFAYGKFRIE